MPGAEAVHVAKRRLRQMVSKQRTAVRKAVNKQTDGVSWTVHLADSGAMHTHVTNMPRAVAAGVAAPLQSSLADIHSAWREGRNAAVAPAAEGSTAEGSTTAALQVASKGAGLDLGDIRKGTSACPFAA